jgi:SNF2 family DNA or RNA helicase
VRIQQDENYRLIYTIYRHEHLGMLIEPNIVLLLNNGNFSLTHQTIHSLNADYFEKGLDSLDFEVIKLIDDIRPDFIVKRFSPVQKIKPKDYFHKHFNKTHFTTTIRPFIEKRMQEILPMLVDKSVYLGEDRNPVHRRIDVQKSEATVLFHIRKNEHGTRYFPTIKLDDERVIFMQNGSRVITHKPCWLAAENRLVRLADGVDSLKIQPFIRKKFVQVSPEQESEYFKTFVTKLMESHHFYAQGLEIRSIKEEARPLIVVSQLPGGKWGVVLKFRYDDHVFPFDREKRVSVEYYPPPDEHFLRIKRSKKWESNQLVFLESLGLTHVKGAQLEVKGRTKRVNILDWLINNRKILENKGFQVEVDTTEKYSLEEPEITTTVSEERDWFDLKIMVKFGEYTIPFPKLKKYILAGEREVELPDGTIGILPEEWFAEMQSLLPFSQSATAMRIARSQYGLIEKSSIHNDSDLEQRMLEFQTPSQYEVPKSFKGTLRPYQKEGFDWLCHLRKHGFGGCLADDMGLGKTVQTLAFIDWTLANTGQKEEKSNEEHSKNGVENPQLSLFSAPSHSFEGGVLLVVPTSLIYNWIHEALRFVPHLSLLNYSGQNRSQLENRLATADVIVTSYGTLRNDLELFKQYHFSIMILDESQAIKNPKSQVSRSVRQVKADSRIVLTGTPIENSITDLWSQMSFVNPGILGNQSQFKKRFIVPIEKKKDEETLQQLRTLISPFILRRTKSEVARDLPEKVEQVVYCDMTEDQKSMYEEVKSGYRNGLLKLVKDEGMKSHKLNVLQGLTQLRLIANHPVLADGEYDGSSGKYEELKYKLETLISEGHRVLVFSQFVKQLDRVEKVVDSLDMKYLRLDGTTPSAKRSQLVDHFQSGDVPVFLISLKAGGTGLNLTAADYVFLLDPWWNPAVEQQAQDRSHRIGQDQTVFTYKFITRDTVEEKILQLQKEKLKLSQDVIATESSFLSSLEAEEMEEILR